MPKAPIIEKVNKIVVLRSGALGDFLVITPALNSLKALYPQAEIALIGAPWMKDYVLGRTPIDRFIEAPIYKGIRNGDENQGNQEENQAFFLRMQQESFDIAIQLQGNGISANPFITQLGAKLTVGISCEDALDLDRFISFYYYQNEVIRNLEVVGLLGAKPVTFEPSVKVLEKDFLEVSQYLEENQIDKYIVLHPCAMDIRRSWPSEKFAKLGALLAEKGFQVIFSGSEKDRPTIDSIIGGISDPVYNSSGRLSLGGLSALLAKSELVIASDTGPLHLARAVNANTVGIYWAPNLINWGPNTRKNHRPVVSWEMVCPICGTVPNNPYPFLPQGETCDHHISFVREVKVEQVIEQAEFFLKKEKSTGILL